MIPEATASGAVSAGKINLGGAVALLVGWASNATVIAIVGLLLTIAGFVWSRIDARAKRREEHEAHVRDEEERAERMRQEEEEHQARMKILQLQLDAAVEEAAG